MTTKQKTKSPFIVGKTIILRMSHGYYEKGIIEKVIPNYLIIKNAQFSDPYPIPGGQYYWRPHHAQVPKYFATSQIIFWYYPETT